MKKLHTPLGDAVRSHGERSSENVEEFSVSRIESFVKGRTRYKTCASEVFFMNGSGLAEGIGDDVIESVGVGGIEGSTWSVSV
jgi:hypothetical protein